MLGGYPATSTRSSEFPREGMSGPSMPDNNEFSSQCACMVNDTHGYMGGGYEVNVRNLAYLLEIDTGSWLQLPSMSQGRIAHACGSVNGGTELVVAGGWDFSHNYFDSTEVLDIEIDDYWRTVAPLPGAFAYPGSVPYGDTFLVVGGQQNSWDERRMSVLYYTKSAQNKIYKRSLFLQGNPGV